MFAQRRQRVMERMEDAVAIFFAAPETTRNNDVTHAYRQHSDMFYLTGFEEPESVLVLAPGRDGDEQVVLFLRERDPEREIWDGARVGVDRAVKQLKVDVAYPIDELEQRLPSLLIGASRVYYELGDAPRNQLLLAAMRKAKRARRDGHKTVRDILDPGPLLHALRLIKGPEEIEAMRASADLAARGHRLAMQAARPGLSEYQLQAVIEHEWRMNGSRRNAYDSIVGSGPNACVLHYHENDRTMHAEDLVLIDAGCELAYLASDITRTWPIGGRFSEPQRRVYEWVLKAQEAAIAVCRPGLPYHGVHNTAVRVLTEGMLDLGLLEGDLDTLIAEETYKRYYMHGTSHWIGMDVHDVGDYFIDGESRALAAGMALTVEPGLYISPTDTDAPEALRGIGIRIEDDILVTTGEPEVLSARVPKSVEALEALIGTAALA